MGYKIVSKANEEPNYLQRNCQLRKFELSERHSLLFFIIANIIYNPSDKNFLDNRQLRS